MVNLSPLGDTTQEAPPSISWSEFTDNNYTGVPALIVEILSPSTAWIDISKKLELYQNFGVKEYWIISPKNSNVQVFNLNEDNVYDEPIIYYKHSMVQSNIFTNLNLDLKELFPSTT